MPEGNSKVKVVTFSEHGAKTWNPQKRRRMWSLLTFIPCVLIPVILSVIYFGFIAADRYSVETKFSIRSPSGFAPNDIVGMMTGVSSSGSTMLDSYIVADFIESNGLLDKLEQRMDIRAVYDTENADFLRRFDRTQSREDFHAYFSWFIAAYFDTSSQVITVEVQAFTPQDAKRVAEEILALCQELVNEISENARLDTVRTAEMEVGRAEGKLRDHRKRVAEFREQEQDIDPTISAGAQQTLLGKIEGRLAEARSELGAMLEFLDKDSPQVKIRESEITALTFQLEAQKDRLGGGETITGAPRNSITAKVGAYEELAVDLEFLQRAYLSALVSLEAARLEADRQQRYVAAFVLPNLPQDAAYPQRKLSILLTLVFSFMLWGIATMIAYIIREHTN